MAAVSIRNLDDNSRESACGSGLPPMVGQWRPRCAQFFVEAVREPSDEKGLLEALADRFGELGGVDLDLPPRSAAPRAVDFTS